MYPLLMHYIWGNTYNTQILWECYGNSRMWESCGNSAFPYVGIHINPVGMGWDGNENSLPTATLFIEVICMGIIFL